MVVTGETGGRLGAVAGEQLPVGPQYSRAGRQAGQQADCVTLPSPGLPHNWIFDTKYAAETQHTQVMRSGDENTRGKYHRTLHTDNDGMLCLVAAPQYVCPSQLVRRGK